MHAIKQGDLFGTKYYTNYEGTTDGILPLSKYQDRM